MPPPDEDAFRLRRQAALDHFCPFERALLARCVACSRARTVLLAEREAIGCDAQTPSERCHDFRERLRTAARFALRADPSKPWPFSQEIRLQCGGLIGLSEALDADADADADADIDADVDADAVAAAAVADVVQGPSVADVDALVQRALQRYREFDALPWSRIIRAVTRYVPRRRAPR